MEALVVSARIRHPDEEDEPATLAVRGLDIEVADGKADVSRREVLQEVVGCLGMFGHFLNNGLTEIILRHLHDHVPVLVALMSLQIEMHSSETLAGGLLPDVGTFSNQISRLTKSGRSHPDLGAS
jgi:hypothetical protein